MLHRSSLCASVRSAAANVKVLGSDFSALIIAVRNASGRISAGSSRARYVEGQNIVDRTDGTGRKSIACPCSPPKSCVSNLTSSSPLAEQPTFRQESDQDDPHRNGCVCRPRSTGTRRQPCATRRKRHRIDQHLAGDLAGNNSNFSRRLSRDSHAWLFFLSVHGGNRGRQTKKRNGNSRPGAESTATIL